MSPATADGCEQQLGTNHLGHFALRGDYFGPKGPLEMTGPPAKAYMSKHARNDETAQKLWELSEHLTGVTYAI